MAQRVSGNRVAFILAAGMGSRLGNLTLDKPKALVKIGNTPMIDRLLHGLQQQGFNQFIVNVHHHADVLQEYIESKFPELNIRFSDERNQLLDTGGALLKLKPMFSDETNLLVHNVDVILPFEPIDMLESHLENSAICTLAVSDRKSSRKLLFDSNNRLCGWKNSDTGEIRKALNFSQEHKEFAFSGVHWMNTQFYNYNTHQERFSIIDSWLNICHKIPIMAYEHSCKGWFDLGTEMKIKEAEIKLNLQ